ncbi:MAG: ABC transporter ATP-binding protein [Planctomycetota bacterium]|jgi:lipoprotein-releasing system ATP-binding protein
MTELLRTENVTKSFSLGRREIPVLQGVDLAVAEGEMLALLGESGAGKSTLLHLLGLLDQPTGGQVLYQGRAVQTLSVRERARLRHREIGFVFQFYHLIPELNALQNVKLGQMMLKAPLAYLRERKAIHDRAVQLLRSVGLGDRLGHRPTELSGGERQRVAIARALISEPRVILSTPTGNLDSTTAEGVLDILFRLNREQSIAFVMVTHNQDLAGRCDRVVHLRDGVVVG